MQKIVLEIGLLAVLMVASCDAADDSGSETPKWVTGEKTLAEVGPDGIPVEEHGFITMNASSSGDIVIAAAAHGKLYYSDDGGQTWWTLDGIGIEEYWTGASVSEDGLHLAAAGSSLYVSDDSGDTWTVHPFVENYDGQAEIKISDDGATIAKGGESTVTELDVSHDYGETWIENKFQDCDNLAAFALSGDGQKIAALHYFEPLKISDDGGETWQDAASGTGQWQHMAMSPDGMKMALLDHGGVKYEGEAQFDVYLSADGGDTWVSTMVKGIQGALAVSMTDDGTRLLVSGGSPESPFVLSVDSGTTWEEIPTPEKQSSDWPQYTTVFSNGGDRIVAMERSYSVWTSEDLGLTWEKRLEGRGAE